MMSYLQKFRTKMCLCSSFKTIRAMYVAHYMRYFVIAAVWLAGIWPVHIDWKSLTESAACRSVCVWLWRGKPVSSFWLVG